MSQQVLDRFYQAELAVERLVKMRVEVDHIEVNKTRPRIWLLGRDEELRGKFGGGIHLIMPTRNDGRVVVMAALFEGCQLHWRRKL